MVAFFRTDHSHSLEQNMVIASTRYPRGSEWRKWDLHVHTPFSALNNGFGQDFDRYAAVLLRKAVEQGVAAIGVTDYFLIDGYARLCQLLANVERLTELLGEDVAA